MTQASSIRASASPLTAAIYILEDFIMCILYELTRIGRKTQAKFQKINQFGSEYNETAELLYKGLQTSVLFL